MGEISRKDFDNWKPRIEMASECGLHGLHLLLQYDFSADSASYIVKRGSEEYEYAYLDTAISVFNKIRREKYEID